MRIPPKTIEKAKEPTLLQCVSKVTKTVGAKVHTKDKKLSVVKCMPGTRKLSMVKCMPGIRKLYTVKCITRKQV